VGNVSDVAVIVAVAAVAAVVVFQGDQIERIFAFY
jgi:hypothetical protein